MVSQEPSISSSASSPITLRRGTTTPLRSRPTSTHTSPRTSRETSPTRHASRRPDRGDSDSSLIPSTTSEQNVFQHEEPPPTITIHSPITTNEQAHSPHTLQRRNESSDAKSKLVPAEKKTRPNGGRPDPIEEDPTEDEAAKEEAQAKPSKPPPIQSRPSSNNLPLRGKSTASEGSVRNMTVETETVSSVPQVAVSGGASDRHASIQAGGSVRIKSSHETMRPKKKRGPRRLHVGGSSKADIFEAKVASAVDEANSSDSDETFVYESNPPEPLSARPHRFHSRTPSTASTFSLLDPHAVKTRADGQHTLVSKKSMKFVNSVGYAETDGTVRGPYPRGSITPHHHHIRFSRSGHPSLFDTNSPFEATHSPRSAKPFSRPHSPRHSSSQVSLHKPDDYVQYDLECADDERTLLLGPPRSARGRRRPLPGSVRQTYADNYRERPYWTGWLSLAGAIMLLVAAVVVMLVLCSKSLLEVQVREIRNVLASESEIMLDLHVQAVNPNLVAVQVSDLDLNMFAKSRHVGSSFQATSIWPFPGKPGVDKGTDPMQEAQTMLLGRITTLDSPLIFEASPLYRYPQASTGLLRLTRPGNRTEEDGSLRWEHVVLYDFELILRGVIKYSLPLGGHVRSASIAARTVVRPGENERVINM